MATIVSSPKLGVDFTKVITNNVLTYSHTLGDIQGDANGTFYVFCRTTSALNAGYTYILDQTMTVGAAVSNASINNQVFRAVVPQVAVAAPTVGTYSYFWAAVEGPMQLFDASQPAQDAILYTSTNTGSLASTSGSNYKLFGIKYTGAAVGVSLLRSAYATNSLSFG